MGLHTGYHSSANPSSLDQGKPVASAHLLLVVSFVVKKQIAETMATSFVPMAVLSHRGQRYGLRLLISAETILG